MEKLEAWFHSWRQLGEDSGECANQLYQVLWRIPGSSACRLIRSWDLRQKLGNHALNFLPGRN